VRRLIATVKESLAELEMDEQDQVQEAMVTIRKSRAVVLGMPRVGRPVPDVRPERLWPMSNPGSRRTQAMVHGRQADTERRRFRVEQAMRDLQKAGEEVSVAAVVRRAKADRTFLYRHRDLLSEVRVAEGPPPQMRSVGPGSHGPR
jgi:hypothetical protein